MTETTEAGAAQAAESLKGDNKGVEKLKEQAREKLEELRHKAKDGYEKASERVHETLQKVGETSLKDVQDSVCGYVKENPGRSLLIAAGVGFLAGALLRGRRR